MAIKFPPKAAPAAPSLADAISRARKSRAVLDQVTDKLNEQITEAEKAIAALRLGVRGSVQIFQRDDGFERYLSFTKIDDQWRLAIEDSHVSREDMAETTPLVNAARSIRLSAVGSLTKLVERLVQNVDAEVKAVESGVASTASFVKSLSAAIDPPPPADDDMGSPPPGDDIPF